MANNHYVLFALNSQQYALRLGAVDRIIQLPELAALPDAPAHMAGIFDLNGTMVPVMDLSILFNRPVRRYFLTDNVIVFHGSGHPFGIIVNEVIDVRPIAGASTETAAVG